MNMKTLSDLYQHRQHLMANIALADNKASSLMLIYKDSVNSSIELEHLNKAYMNVISPVLSTESKEDTFALPISYVELYDECEVLKDIVDTKYRHICIMLKIIRAEAI